MKVNKIVEEVLYNSPELKITKTRKVSVEEKEDKSVKDLTECQKSANRHATYGLTGDPEDCSDVAEEDFTISPPYPHNDGGSWVKTEQLSRKATDNIPETMPLYGRADSLTELYSRALKDGHTILKSYDDWFAANITRLCIHNIPAMDNPAQEAFDFKVKFFLHGLNIDIKDADPMFIKSSISNHIETPVLRTVTGGDTRLGELTGYDDINKLQAPVSKFRGLNEFIDGVGSNLSNVEDRIDFVYNQIFAKLPPVIAANLVIINNISDKTVIRPILAYSPNKIDEIERRVSEITFYMPYTGYKTKPFMTYLGLNRWQDKSTFNLSITGFLHDIYSSIIDDIDSGRYGKSNISCLKESVIAVKNNLELILNNNIFSKDIDCINMEATLEESINSLDKLRNRSIDISNGRTILRGYLEDVLKAPVLGMTCDPFSMGVKFSYRAYNVKGILFVFDYFDGHVRVYAPEEENDSKIYVLSDTYVDIPFTENIIPDVIKFVKTLYRLESQKVLCEED